MCLLNVQCVHYSLGEIRKQQISELSLTLHHSEQVTLPAVTQLYVAKKLLIDLQKLFLSPNLKYIF